MPESGFFSPDFRERVRAAVAAIEARTGAEVVVCVRPRSGTYEGSRHAAGAIAAFALLLVFLFHPIEFSVAAMPSGEALAYALAYWFAGRSSHLQRLLTPRRVRDGQTALAARAAFFELGVTETKRRVGVLVYASLLEQRVELLGDRGLAPERLGDAWERCADALRASFAHGPATEPFVRALESLGPVLEHAAPRTNDDTNELPDAPHADEDAPREARS